MHSYLILISIYGSHKIVTSQMPKPWEVASCCTAKLGINVAQRKWIYFIYNSYDQDVPATKFEPCHYDDVMMSAIASQITSLAIVYSIVYSDADQRKQQSSVTRKMFPFDDVIMFFPLFHLCIFVPYQLFAQRSGIWYGADNAIFGQRYATSQLPKHTQISVVLFHHVEEIPWETLLHYWYSVREKHSFFASCAERIGYMR